MHKQEQGETTASPERKKTTQETASQPSTLPGWLSVREVAQLSGRSPGSIRRFIASGLLPASRERGRLLIGATNWRQFVAQHLSAEPVPLMYPTASAHIITTWTAQLCEGQQEAFDALLRVMAHQQLHSFPGTLDRMILQNKEQPEKVEVLLIWDETTIPTRTIREAMMEDLRSDFVGILDWENGNYFEQRIKLETRE